MIMSDSPSEQGRWSGWVLVLIVVAACFLILYFFGRHERKTPIMEIMPGAIASSDRQNKMERFASSPVEVVLSPELVVR